MFICFHRINNKLSLYGIRNLNITHDNFQLISQSHINVNIHSKIRVKGGNIEDDRVYYSIRLRILS